MSAIRTLVGSRYACSVHVANLAAGLTDPDRGWALVHESLRHPLAAWGRPQKPARGGETHSLAAMPAIENMDDIDDADLALALALSMLIPSRQASDKYRLPSVMAGQGVKARESGLPRSRVVCTCPRSMHYGSSESRLSRWNDARWISPARSCRAYVDCCVTVQRYVYGSRCAARSPCPLCYIAVFRLYGKDSKYRVPPIRRRPANFLFWWLVLTTHVERRENGSPASTKRSEDWPDSVASASAAPSADVTAAENWTGDRASRHFKWSID